MKSSAILGSLLAMTISVGAIGVPSPVMAESTSVESEAPELSSVEQELLGSPRPVEPPVEIPETSSDPNVIPVREREVLDARTETSRTWEMSDGSLQVQEYEAPTFFEEDGKWQRVDTDLTQDVDGRWETTASGTPVSFGGGDQADSLQQISVDDGTIAFSPQQTSTEIQDPRVVDASAVYDEVWPDADLKYTALPDGSKELIVLHSTDANYSYTFDVTGGTLRETDDGGADILRGDELVASIPPPTVFTSGDAAATSGIDATAASDVQLTVDGSAMTVAVSQDWLTSLPAADLPVIIDPTVEVYRQDDDEQTYLQSVSVASDGTTYFDPRLRVGVDSAGIEWRSTLNAQPPTTHLPSVPAGTPGWRLFDVQLNNLKCPTTYPCSGGGMNLSIRGNDTNRYNYVYPEFDTIGFGPAIATSSFQYPQRSATGPENLPGALLANYMAGRPDGSWLGFAPVPDGSRQCNGSDFRSCYRGTVYDIGSYDVSIIYSYLRPSEPTTVESPIDGAVLSNTTPRLSAEYVSTNVDVWYNFRLSTDKSGASQTVESGWLKEPYWTVPKGSFRDGVTYYATVLANGGHPFTEGDMYYYCKQISLPCSTIDNFYVKPAPPGKAISFTIKQRLGEGGPSPTDNVGQPPGSAESPSQGAPSPGVATASETVNMATGNLAVKLGNSQVKALAGPVGVNLLYNSQRSSTISGDGSGLLGRYYADDGSHNFPLEPLGQREDAGVSLSWAAGTTPFGVLPPGTRRFMVRWTGQVRLPAGSSWLFGGVHDGGMRVFLDGATTPFYDRWSSTTAGSLPNYGTQSANGGTALHDIVVESWFDQGLVPPSRGNSQLELWVMQTGLSTTGEPNQFLLPSSWTSPAARTLPSGWSTSPTGGVVEWIRATDAQSQVVLISPSGDTQTFKKSIDGTLINSTGTSDSLTRDNRGRLQLLSSAGGMYRFDNSGELASFSTAADDRHPTALIYAYSGAPSALRSITDPVSERSVTLSYGGQTACPSANGAPSGMLCQISSWGARKTAIVYNNNGQLAKVVGHGGGTTMFGYNQDGQMNQVRDELAYDYISSGMASGDASLSTCTSGAIEATCPLDTSISYSSGAVSRVTQPRPEVGAVRPSRSYFIGSNASSVVVDGFNPSSGRSQTVFYDDEDRLIAQRSPMGTYSGTVWDAKGHAIATVDSSNLQTSKTYDSDGQVTAIYGPAPVRCFSSPLPDNHSTLNFSNGLELPIRSYLPVNEEASGCGLPVPKLSTAFDDNLQSLGATYFSNGGLSGIPARHATGVATTGSQFCISQLVLCADWGTGSVPVPPEVDGHWSLRLRGTITNATGVDLFRLRSTQPVRLVVDEETVLINGPESNSQFRTGELNNADAAVSLAPGVHNISLEFVGDARSLSRFDLRSRQTGSSAIIGVPLSSLNPNYGLPTKSIDPDGIATATTYEAPGIDAAFGLATASVLDPDGLALTDRTEFEAPDASSFLRRVSSSLPAGNTTNYESYSGTEGPIAATCGVASTVPQGGQVKALIQPSSDGSGQRRRQEFIYDVTGRQVGSRIGTNDTIAGAGWRCTTFDSRGRVVKKTWPAFGSAAARTTTYAYAVNGNPLVSSVTSGTTITSTVDLLGRLTSYKDALGMVSTISYDQAGRMSETNGAQGRLTNAYDPDSGLLTGLSVNGEPTAAVDYNSGGKVRQVFTLNNVMGEWLYDPYGRVSQREYTRNDVQSGNTTIAGIQHRYSLAGRIRAELSANQGGQYISANPDVEGDTYTYDSAGRLATAWLPRGEASYGYQRSATDQNCEAPSAGRNTNRTSVTLRTAAGDIERTAFCYDRADRITSLTNGAGQATESTDRSYVYDEHGNQTQDGAGVTLTFDAADRVSTTSAIATTGTSTTTYIFDALDRVIRRISDGVSTGYVYSGFSDSPVATTNGSLVTQRFISMPGDIGLAIDSTGKRTWSYADLRGNVIATLAEGTTTVLKAKYDPWGDPLAKAGAAQAGPGAAFGAFGLNHKVTDRASGLIVMGARVYNPHTARFASVDSLQGGCANAYVYSYGDPINGADLSGRSWKSCLSTAGTVVGGAALLTGLIALTPAGASLTGVASVLGAISLGLDGASCLLIAGSRLANCVAGSFGAAGGVISGARRLAPVSGNFINAAGFSVGASGAAMSLGGAARSFTSDAGSCGSTIAGVGRAVGSFFGGLFS